MPNPAQSGPSVPPKRGGGQRSTCEVHSPEAQCAVGAPIQGVAHCSLVVQKNKTKKHWGTRGERHSLYYLHDGEDSMAAGQMSFPTGQR